MVISEMVDRICAGIFSVGSSRHRRRRLSGHCACTKPCAMMRCWCCRLAALHYEEGRSKEWAWRICRSGDEAAGYANRRMPGSSKAGGIDQTRWWRSVRNTAYTVMGRMHDTTHERRREAEREPLLARGASGSI